MGKWAEVQCNCPNRVPVANSDLVLSEPHRKKRRLTKKEKEEVENWKRTTKDMFECGHRNGVVVEFSLGDIILLGDLIGSIYRDDPNPLEVFTRVGDWRCYENELLLIPPDEALRWRLEIELVQQSLQGFGQMLQRKVQRLIVEFFRQKVGAQSDLERRLGQVAGEMPFFPVTSLQGNVHRQSRPTAESTVDKILDALADAERLCRASTETGNPIRLLW